MKIFLIGISLGFAILFFSLVIHAQCPNVLVTPYSGAITRGVVSNVQHDPYFTLERGKESINHLSLDRTGRIYFKGKDLNPPLNLDRGVQEADVYQSWDPTLVIVPRTGSNSTSKIFLLNEDNCLSLVAKLPKFAIDRIIWNKKNGQLATLCDADRSRFARINFKIGMVSVGRKSKAINPCFEVIPYTGSEKRVLRTLEGAIIESLKLLENGQFEAFLRLYTVNSREDVIKYDLKAPTAPLNVEQFAKYHAENLIHVLRATKSLTPEYEARSNTATYHLPSGRFSKDWIRFTRIKGIWYLCEFC